MDESIKERLAVLRKGDVPQGYRKTKTGIMPIDWDDTVRAKDLFKNYADKKHNGDLEILASTQDNGIVPRSQIGIDIQCSDEGVAGYKKVSKGDFVISLRSFQGGIEYSEYEGIVSPAYTILKPIKEISDGYFRNYFKTNTFIQRLNSAVYGIRDGKQIGYQDFGDLHIHYPPIAEQKKIAEILAQCDKIIELKEKCLEEEKRRKQWLVKNILTGKIRLDKFSAPWEETTIGNCVEYLVGYPFASDKFTSCGIRLLRCSNVKRGCLSWEPSLTMYWRKDDLLKPFLMQPGDIVVAMDGALIGRSFAVVEESDTPSYLVQRVARIRSKMNNLIFQWISSDKFARHIDSRKTSTAIPHMTIKDILSFKISIPKSALEATVIGSALQNQDKIIRLLTEEIYANKQQKKALMQLLLTGTVRVKTQ